MLENKTIMAMNIKQKLLENEVSRQHLAKAIGVPYSTVSEWINAKKYPRIDKIEMMANFFGCEKSDLIEVKKIPATENGNGISKAKEKLIEKVMQMSDDELQKLELLLRIVEAK